jgi:hypothetical protein
MEAFTLSSVTRPMQLALFFPSSSKKEEKRDTTFELSFSFFEKKSAVSSNSSKGNISFIDVKKSLPQAGIVPMTGSSLCKPLPSWLNAHQVAANTLIVFGRIYLLNITLMAIISSISARLKKSS